MLVCYINNSWIISRAYNVLFNQHFEVGSVSRPLWALFTAMSQVPVLMVGFNINSMCYWNNPHSFPFLVNLFIYLFFKKKLNLLKDKNRRMDCKMASGKWVRIWHGHLNLLTWKLFVSIIWITSTESTYGQQYIWYSVNKSGCIQAIFRSNSCLMQPQALYLQASWILWEVRLL